MQVLENQYGPRYGAAIASSGVPFAFADHEARITEANDAFVQLLGYSSETDVIGRTGGELAADPQVLTDALGQLLAQGLWSGDLRLRRRDGSVLETRVCASTLFGLDGSITGVAGSFIDVSDCRAAERSRAQLHEVENRFRLVTENIREVTWMTDPVKREVLYVSPAYETVWQRSCASLYARPWSWLDAVHPDDRDRVEKAALTRQSDGAYDEEYRVLRPDGSTVWVRDRAVPVRDASGNVYRIVGIAEDVTAAKLAEARLVEREAYYRSLIENASDSITVVDAAGTITYQSPSSWRVLGVRADDMVGRSAFAYMHPDDVTGVADALRRALLETTDAVAVNFRLRHRNGAWLYVEAVGRALPSADGEVVVNSRDVTERRLAELRVLEQRQHLELQARLLGKLQSVARIGGWEMDIATGDLIVTEGMHHIHEADPERYAPTLETGLSFYPPASRALLVEALTHARESGRGWDLDLEMVTARGRATWVRVVGESIMEEGRPVRLVGAVQDITEQRQLQLQVHQARKLDAVGQLSAGIAHDFNNLLTIIGADVALLEMDSATTTEQRESLRDIQRAVDRAAALTKQLLTFSRQQQLQRRAIDLHGAIGDIAQMLRRALGETVAVEVLAPEQQLTIMADPGMVDQVILNLAVNARDAMPDGGRLTVSASAEDFDAERARHRAGARPGPFACLSVSDTGAGIPPELLERVFEPFFTTKAAGKGTGLGLSTVHGIVEQHNGWIEIDSREGLGTTFRVYLPRLVADGTPD